MLVATEEEERVVLSVLLLVRTGKMERTAGREEDRRRTGKKMMRLRLRMLPRVREDGLGLDGVDV